MASKEQPLFMLHTTAHRAMLNAYIWPGNRRHKKTRIQLVAKAGCLFSCIS